MLWAPLTNRLSANNALQDSDKTAQVVFSIFLSLAVNGAELSPPFQNTGHRNKNASPVAHHRSQQLLNDT